MGIVGAGNMGQALLKGLLGAGVPASRLTVVEVDPRKRRQLRGRFRVASASIETLAGRCDVILLAVKPQDMPPVLEALRRSMRAQRPLVISIAAGLTIASLQRALGPCPLIRVMPNLPAKVGEGISAMAEGRWARPAHRRLAKAILRCVGEVVELPERCFDAVTALSGSGPAYFFLIFRALRDAGVAEGLPRAVAQRLVIHTALGSARVAAQSAEELETMIAQVASKGGTTEAALKVLARRKLAQALQAGVHAARRRSQELTRCLS